MTSTTIKVERVEELTTFSFNVLASKTNNIISTPSVFVLKIDDDDFFVHTDDCIKDIEKTFSNEDEADLYAMKIIMHNKKQYNQLK